MNGAQLQAKLYSGYAKAALRLGLPFNQYRPTVATAPAISAGNLVQSLPVSLNAEDMTYQRPRGYAKATWYALADGTQLQPGDYLVRSTDNVVFFVAAMQPLLPILVVECNRVLTVSTPQRGSGAGQRGYGGTTAENVTQIVNQWPASALQGSKGEKSQVNLPGDTRQPWWIVLLPNLPGTQLQTDYEMTDDVGRRYVISSAEQSALGWRLSAAESGT